MTPVSTRARSAWPRMAIAALIPLFVFALLTFPSRDDAPDDSSAPVALRLAAQRMTDDWQRMDERVRSLAAGVSSLREHGGELTPFLSGLTWNSDRWLFFGVMDADGKLLARTPLDASPDEHLPRPGEIGEEGVRRASLRLGKSPAASFAYPVRGAEGADEYLVAFASLAPWKAMIADAAGDSSTVVLLDERGHDPFAENGASTSFEPAAKVSVAGPGWTLAQSNRTEAPKPRAFPWAPLAVATALAFIGAALAARSTRGASSEAVPSATAFAAADSQAPDPATARAALVATIERVLDGDNEARAPQEAGEAGQALNRLLDGLALVKERIDQKARVQALARLSSGLAHDLRHPVGNVKTFKGLLATEPNDATLMDEYLSLVDTEIDRVDKFVEGFSELARPVMYNPTRLAVRGLVEKCLGEIRPAADVKKVVILAEHAPDAMVLADEMHLGRAILEVLEFSLQATRSGGEIRVWTGEAPDGVAVEVRDAGQGTPLEGVEGIFDSYLTRGRGGGGLSLAMARRLVVEMGGRVSARTDGERGSLYRIVFAPMDHETPYDE